MPVRVLVTVRTPVGVKAQKVSRYRSLKSVGLFIGGLLNQSKGCGVIPLVARNASIFGEDKGAQKRWGRKRHWSDGGSSLRFARGQATPGDDR